MAPNIIILILALLLGLQPVTTDLYLPALPALTESFGASMGQTQLTLSALLLAFGVSQLIWGPLSDRFGRKPILLIGLSAYVLAALGAAFASSMELLIVWRTLQGVAMGAAVMCARATIRDLFTPALGARVMSKALSGLGVIACLSPPLGGILSDHFDWRAALLAVALFSAATLAIVALYFVETVPQKNPQALRFGQLAKTWWHILRNPVFLTYSVLAAASYGALFSILASSSFVLIKVFDLSKTQYGLTMSCISISYIIGTFICRRLLTHYGMRRTIAIASTLSFGGASALVALAWRGQPALWLVLLPCCLVVLAHGVNQPCSQSASIGPFPQAAGTASALNGFIMMLVAFATGSWLSRHLNNQSLDNLWPMAQSIWFWCSVIAFVGWTAGQKYGSSK